MHSNESRVLIVGGGAAGMMAAVAAGRAGAEVLVLERNEKLGKKVYITGKGRCNVTNDCDREEFLRQVPRNPRFLYSALSVWSSQDTMQLLESSGCPVVVQRGRRVFPATEKASDVIRTFTRLIASAGAQVRLNCRVRELWLEDGVLRGVITEGGEKLAAGAVLLCCGGRSYPMTGSTGDGYRLAEQAGHTIVKPEAVLSALVTGDGWEEELQGLSLKNVRLTLKKGKKVLYDELGEMLFTHFGISGPLVLEVSCHLPEDLADAALTLDLKPGLTPEQLHARLQRDFAEQPRKLLRSILPGLLPARLAELFPQLCGVEGDVQCSQVTREMRETLVQHLKALPLRVTGRCALDEAIVTRGGVSVKEVQSASMESRLLPRLFFAGEMLDVDAHTGGYNLQIAFATGTLAGRSAAESLIPLE